MVGLSCEALALVVPALRERQRRVRCGERRRFKLAGKGDLTTPGVLLAHAAAWVAAGAALAAAAVPLLARAFSIAFGGALS